MPRSAPRTALAAALLAALSAPAADAQVNYTDVTAAVGLDFMHQYGPTLPYEPDISFPFQQGLDIIQRNNGNGAAVGDYDNDGDLDIFFTGQKTFRSALYRNDLPTGFTNVTASAGIFNRGQSRMAQFTDLDNDGWVDLILANDKLPGSPTTKTQSGGFFRGQVLTNGNGGSPFAGQADAGSSVYRNNGDGTFTDVAEGSGFDFTGYIIGGMGTVDFDQDGLVDVYVTTWGGLQDDGPLDDDDYTLMEGYCRLYWNRGNFQFQDVTRLMGLGKLQTNAFTPIFADFDRDGDSDLFISVDAYPDKFYRFDGGIFVDQSAQVGATHVGTDMGVAAADFDDDGDVDLYVTNVTDPAGAYGGNTLLVNQLIETGTLSFVDEAVARGVHDTGWGWGTEWVDVDNDGDRDLYAVSGYDDFVLWEGLHVGMIDRPADLFINDGSGFFTPSVNTGAEVVGDARVAIAFDADRDGDQDLLVTHVDVPPALLLSDLNDTAPVNHWIDLKLVGAGSVPRDAIGARITLLVGSQTMTHEVIGGGSYMAGLPLEAHFGLGSATLIDQIRVGWPDNTSTILNDVAVDQYLVIQHP